MAVDDRLRQPGRARASRAPTAGGRTARGSNGELAAGPARARPTAMRAVERAGVEVRQRARCARATASRRAARATTSRRSKSLAAVAVAVDGEQHLRLDLREAVDHAARAEVRRAATTRSRRCDAQARKRDDRLGDVRQVGGDAVARADAERAQAGRDRGRPGARSSPQRQLAERPQLATRGRIATRRRRACRGRRARRS